MKKLSKRNSKLIWHIIRILTFYLLGIMNTVLIRPEHLGTIKNYIGYALLVVAIMYTAFFAYRMWVKGPVE